MVFNDADRNEYLSWLQKEKHVKPFFTRLIVQKLELCEKIAVECGFCDDEGLSSLSSDSLKALELKLQNIKEYQQEDQKQSGQLSMWFDWMVEFLRTKEPESRAKSISWDEFEAIFLFEAYLEARKKGISKETIISLCSRILRKRMIQMGEQPNSASRSEEDVASKLTGVLYLVTGGKTGNGKISRLFQNAFQMSRHDPTQYTFLVEEAKRQAELCAEAETKILFPEPEPEQPEAETALQEEISAPVPSSQEQEALTLLNEDDDDASTAADMSAVDDMDSAGLSIDHSDAYELADSILKNYPLIGAYDLTETEAEECETIACRTVKKLSSGQYITIKEKAVLVFYTVHLVQKHDFESDKLWEHIFSSYGVDAHSYKAENGFRKIIKDIMNGYHRFFAPPWTQQYYTTLLAHAMAPSKGLNRLFDILLQFFGKNMEFRYTSGEPVFQILAQKLSGRRNFDLFAGLDALFKARPDYMSRFCDEIVGKMDLLLKNESFEEATYLDRRLREWYEQKSQMERHSLNSRRRSLSRDRIVDKKELIEACYHLENRSLCIRIPKIRLPEITERPLAVLWQGEREVYSTKLSVFGDELCYTSREFRFDLAGCKKINWNEPLNFRIQITCDKASIYDSAESLFRSYILFDSNGNEGLPKGQNESVLLCANDASEVDIHDPEDTWDDLSGQYQLYQLPLASVMAVLVDGKNVPLSSLQNERNGFRGYCVPFPLSGAELGEEDRRCVIFTRSPALHILLDEQEQLKNYHLISDSELCPLYDLAERRGSSFEALLAGGSGVHHIKVKNFQTGAIVYELRYMVLEDFSWQFDRPYYPNKEVTGLVSLCINQRVQELRFTLEADQSAISIKTAALEERLHLKVPKFNLSLKGENAFALPEHLWHKDISKDAFLVADLPKGFQFSAFFGNAPIPMLKEGPFEVGNSLGVQDHSVQSLPLWYRVEKDGQECEHTLLTSIEFEERFLAPPVYQEGRSIYWNKADTYIGDSHVLEMKVYIENDQSADPWVYDTSLDFSMLEKHFPCQVGTYHYQVYRAERTIFKKGKTRLLYEGDIVIEPTPEERYADRFIDLTDVCYTRDGRQEFAPIHEGDALIYDIRYLGQQMRRHSPVELYEGRLYYYNLNDEMVQFPTRWDGEEVEPINPVKFWTDKDNHLWMETVKERSLRLRLDEKIREEIIYHDNTYAEWSLDSLSKTGDFVNRQKETKQVPYVDSARIEFKAPHDISYVYADYFTYYQVGEE